MHTRANSKAYLKNLIFSKLFLGFIVIVIFFIAVTIVKGFAQRIKVSQDVERLKTDISKLENNNSDLNSLLTYLQSSEFIKQEGKVKFGLREPGEHAVILQDGPNQRREIAQTSTAQTKLSNPQKWLKYFFDTAHE